jgi:Cu/Ag efflux pump CusA
VSLETTVEMTTRMEKCLLKFPEVESVICKSGRPEIANDPMMINLTDVIVTLKPHDVWAVGSDEELVEKMAAALEYEVPGNAYSFSQPIQQRVDELVSGVRSDVGISLYGDDLDVLRAKAEEVVGRWRRCGGPRTCRPSRPAGCRTCGWSSSGARSPGTGSTPGTCWTRSPPSAAGRSARCTRGSGGSRWSSASARGGARTWKS